MCEEIHCLVWSGTNSIHKHGCHTDLERAERHRDESNKRLKWYHKLYVYRWVVRTYKVQQGPEEAEEVL